MSTEREQFGSRLGVILAIAGSAVGLGNIWRFPYIAGENGGALFIICYVIILFCIGLPILMTELSIGRAAKKSVGYAFETLEPKGTKWHYFKYLIIAGGVLICAYYPVITGNILYYLCGVVDGSLLDKGISAHDQYQDLVVENSYKTVCFSLIAILFCACCSWFGIKKGIETVTKPLMFLLFIFLVVLCGYSLTLDGASKGLELFFVPNFEDMTLKSFLNMFHAALGQVFFTLGVGAGTILAYASYMKKGQSLFNESIIIASLDTIAAILAGVIIFSICTSYSISVGAGPVLVFESMLTIFKEMPGGHLFGSVFFLLLFAAAITSFISMYESTNSFMIDSFNVSRKTAITINTILVGVLILPACFASSFLADIKPFGMDIISFEDFIASNVLLVGGAFIFSLFCFTRYGWGMRRFIRSVNSGEGVKLSRFTIGYIKYAIPMFIFIVFVLGLIV